MYYWLIGSSIMAIGAESLDRVTPPQSIIARRQHKISKTSTFIKIFPMTSVVTGLKLFYLYHKVYK